MKEALEDDSGAFFMGIFKKNWTIERTEPIFYNRKTEYLFGENKFGAGNEKNVHMH